MQNGANSNIKKYYWGVVALFILSLGLVAYTLSQASSAKADDQTTKTVNDVGNSLDGYISTNNLIPDSLSTGGVKNIPATIIYSKLSDTQYKFCATYSSANNGFDAGWTALLGGGLSGLQSSSLTNDSGESTLDTYSLIYQHKKGQNCQTVTPNITPPSVPGDNSSGGSTTLQ